MNIPWFLLVMGIVQGLAQVLPISSTGHLAVLRQLFNIETFNLSMATGLHIGSLVSISLFFRKDIIALWQDFRDSWVRINDWLHGVENSFLRQKELILPYLIGLSLVPVAIEGLIFQNLAQWIFAHKYLPLLLIIMNGAIILVTARKSRGERSLKELTWKEFLFIGMIQGLAVLPGISRLGLVLCTGLWRRLKWQEAIKLTFVLAIPVVIGALLIEGQNIIQSLETNFHLCLFFLAGIILALVSSWYGLTFLTSRILERRKFVFFGYYCLSFGIYSSIYLFFWQ
jgi:undecaprenyl-diphosphatase